MNERSPLFFRSRLVAAAALSLTGIAAHAADAVLAPFGAAGAAPQAPWKVIGLPQQTKPFTKFSVVELDGKRAVKIEADESYGNIVHPLQLGSPGHLAWQWRIEKPLDTADLRQRGGDDTAVKVCVFYDLPIESISFAERQLLRITRGKTTDLVPAATVCYVWDTQLPVGTTLDNAFTRRVRYIVLESGNEKRDRWVSEKRDLGADFLKLFRDESATVPAILGVAVGADSDNTKGHTVSYVSGVAIEP